jgi:hypothetical protein
MPRTAACFEFGYCTQAFFRVRRKRLCQEDVGQRRASLGPVRLGDIALQPRLNHPVFSKRKKESGAHISSSNR